MWLARFFKKNSTYKKHRSQVSIRLEAIGGQGANSIGKILAETAVLGMGYTGNHFSSFGSEKRGTPVKSFIRFDSTKKPVRSSSPIVRPDLLVVFHENLLVTTSEELNALPHSFILILNTPKKVEQIYLPASLQSAILYTIDANQIAYSLNCHLNSVILGAITALTPELQPEKTLHFFENFFSHSSQNIRTQNKKGFEQGFSHIKKRNKNNPIETPLVSNNEINNIELSSIQNKSKLMPDLGWKNAPIGGLITNPGNTVLKDNSISRKGVAPKFIEEACFHCGYCDMICPDYCFVWDKESDEPKLLGIDYQFCKGCQKCVAICPTHALVPEVESKIEPLYHLQKVFPVHEYFRKNANTNNIENSEEASKINLHSNAYHKIINEMPKDLRFQRIQTELLQPHSYFKPQFASEELSKKRRKKE